MSTFTMLSHDVSTTCTWMRTDSTPLRRCAQLPASTVQVGEHATLADAGDGKSRMPLSARQRQRLHPGVQVRASPTLTITLTLSFSTVACA